MDKLSTIRTFVRVTQVGSLAGAGEELGLSRSAVTKQIMWLEDQLGVRLLNRTTRSLSLTEAGVIYRDRCVQILDDLEDAEAELAEGSTAVKGTLQIHAPPSFGMLHIAPMLARFLEEHPGLTGRLSLSDRQPDLAEEGIDVAIRLGNLPDSSLVAHHIATTSLVICAAPRYLDAHGAPDHPTALAHHNCLTWRHGPLERQAWTFEAGGSELEIPVRGTLESNVADVLRMAALEGLGLVVLPVYMVFDDLAAGRLLPVLEAYPPPDMPIHAVYLNRRHLPGKVRLFVEDLKRRFSGRTDWSRHGVEH
jgi:DNA-binding transcriptional LysR family regulator